MYHLIMLAGDPHGDIGGSIPMEAISEKAAQCCSNDEHSFFQVVTEHLG